MSSTAVAPIAITTRDDMRKPRILFVAESVTLAQVVRLAKLAHDLKAEPYELHFAASSFPELAFSELPVQRWPLFTLEPDRVFSALDRGKRIYEKRLLKRYVAADLEVIDSVKPSLIVGDFRLSLATSAALRGIPHATLINAYWSPYAVRERFPVPDHPIVKLLGLEMASRYFPQAMPKVFAHFAKPINDTRRSFGLTAIGSLQDVLVYGDYTLYADTPTITPTAQLPEHHRYLGPVVWSPAVALPELPTGDRPLIYVTLGSSGKVEVLPSVLSALARLPVRVLLATAGRAAPQLPDNVTARDFVPGDQAARRAHLTITNGGSATGYQALAEGCPVLGVASNLDQYLTMDAIERSGAGRLLRAGGLNAEQVTHAVEHMLGDSGYKQRAAAVAADFARWDSAARFRAFVAEVVAGQAGVAASQASS